MPSDIAEGGTPFIEQLPEEILHEIFLLCLPHPRYRASLSPRRAPVLLTHVCRYWRQSAHGLPALWSSLDMQHLRRCNVEALCERIISWFSLSGGIPFTLQLALDDVASKRRSVFEGDHSLPGSREGPSLEALRKDLHAAQLITPGLIYRLLAPIQRNLTNLSLRDVPLMELQRLPRGSFPMLERLSLLLVVGAELKDVDLNPSIPPLCAFVDSPYLRCVAAKHLPPADHLQLPWAQLTHFVEFKCHPDPTWYFLYRHIHSITSLRHLHISLDEFHARHTCNIPGWQAGRSTLPFEPVILPELRKLSLYCPRIYSYTLHPNFWRRFDFPNLQALQIVGYNITIAHPSRQWDPVEVEEFSRKFQGWAHLKHLSLQGVGYIPVDTLVILLSAMPLLTILDFEAHYRHLSLLAHGLDTGVRLVLGLQHLILQFDEFEIDGEEWMWGVLQFVEARMELRRREGSTIMNGGLQKVTIYASNPASQYVLDAVETVLDENEEGMQLEVEVRQRRADLYAGWQSWSDMDDTLNWWPGLGDIAVKDDF